MNASGKAVQFFSVFLFVAGMLLALVLTIFALWPDFEAALFDTTHAGGEPLDSLRCPLLITPSDNAALHLTLNNPLERPVNFLVRANIAQRFVTFMRQENAQAMVQPGESVTFAWSVKPEDAVYGRMILARVRVLRTSELPARQKACGILVLNVPVVRGHQIVGGLLAMTVLYLGLGAVLWLKQERPLTDEKRQRARIVGSLALLLLLTMVMSLIGWWSGSVLILLALILIVVAILEHLNTPKRG